MQERAEPAGRGALIIPGGDGFRRAERGAFFDEKE
jgi:hypothetical protein